MFILIGVTFLTLLEQKLLRYIQIRKGPNKVGLLGIFQPFCDAIKLFSKELIIPINSNYVIYYFSPIFSLFLSLAIWLRFPFLIKWISFELRILYILRCMRIGVYSLIISGWSSNSAYTLLGRLRSIAQTISYEVCIILVIIFYLFIVLRFNLIEFFKYQVYLNFFYLNVVLTFIIIIIFLAETNRAPFNFAEGESELVSGFNTEYGGGRFALIFLSEYSSILFLRNLFCIIFLFNSFYYFMFFMKVVLISFLFVWIRGAFPRFRYDKLIYMTWKIYLSFSLNFLIVVIIIKIYLSL